MNQGEYLAAKNWVNEGCSTEVTPTGGGPVVEVATLKGFECVFANILNVVIRLAGLALLVMLFMGGFKYLTAGGDPKKTQAAQQTITYAFLGLAAIIGAWFIFLLIKTFTGINVLEFNIMSEPTPLP